jgi:hypothetical protein
MSRADQDALLRWALAAISPEASRLPVDWRGLERLPDAALRQVGLATGLTALVGTLAPAVGLELPPAWGPYVADQVAEVARRQDRFAGLLPRALDALDRAGVAAIPVKGAVLSAEVWPHPRARPMADIDLVVAPGDRSAAADALTAAGLRRSSSTPWEDVFLGWGDGGVGRADGESADHNGKVEVHPGWAERIHNYLVDDGGLLLDTARPGTLAGTPCRRLPPAAFAAHVVGHLAACVVRAEVRAVNVVDAVLVLRSLEATERRDFVELTAALDARLVAPGLWLVARHAPDVVPLEALGEGLRRLGAAAGLLASTPSEAVLRDPSARTTWAWRICWEPRGSPVRGRPSSSCSARSPARRRSAPS